MPYRQLGLQAFCQYVLDRIDRTDDEGCWLWCGPGNGGGYGLSAYASPSGTHVAHRVVWEVLVGPIPPGLVLDHTCCNKLCVNPTHLEPVTPQENTKRGGSYRRKAHSKRLDAARQRDAEERKQKRMGPGLLWKMFEAEDRKAEDPWWDEMLARQRELEFRGLIHRLGPTSCGPAFQRLCQLD